MARPPIEERFPRPSVMGVVNVTPDSFSDGGVHLDPDVAAAAARRMVADGAAIVDVGAAEVAGFVEQRLASGVGAGGAEERICLDPGIGFGKTVEHTLELVRRLDVLTALGRPVVVGFSRKSTLGRLLGDPEARTGTTAASVGAAVAALERRAALPPGRGARAHLRARPIARARAA